MVPILQRILIAVFLALLTVHSSLAQEPSAAGLWQKVEGGRPVAWFLVIDHNGTFEGVIAKTFPRPGEDPARVDICSKCTDDRRNAPLLGLSVMRNMTRNGLNYESGTLLDPRDGRIFNARMSVLPDGQRLTLRSHIGPAQPGRNETWQRLPNAALAQLDPAIVNKYLRAQPNRISTSAEPASMPASGAGAANPAATSTAMPASASPTSGGGPGGGGSIANLAPASSSGGGMAAAGGVAAVGRPVSASPTGGGEPGASANGGGIAVGGGIFANGGAAAAPNSGSGVLKFPTNTARPGAIGDEASCKERMRKLGVLTAGPCVDMDGILRELEVGSYKFNAPEKAYLGKPLKLVLALTTSPDQDVEEAFDGVAGGIVERQERFAQSIEAVLHGDDLIVEPSGPQIRTATTVAPVIWEWSVTPQQGGKKKLAIEVFANIQIGTDRNRVQLRTLYQEIEIQVSTLQMVKNYVAEADGLLRAIAAVPALAVLLGFIPKARAKFKAGWRFFNGESKAARRRRV